MEQKHIALNRFLVEVFNEILKTEESCIASSGIKNLSLRELHVIEAVCNAENKNSDNRATAIAADLRITAGTLTTTVSLLEKKGYLQRIREAKDKRVVHICSTELGKMANERHAQFHAEMIDNVLRSLTDEEATIFVHALKSINTFFKVKYDK